MVTQSLFTALHLVDAVWVGRLGREALAGVVLAGSIVGILFSASQVFSVAVMAVAARAAGAEDRQGVADALRHGLLLCLGFSLPLAALGAFFSRDILNLFRAETAVVALGTPYLRLIMVAAPAFFCGIVCYSLYQALGDTRTPMYVMLGSNLLNMALDPLLIFGWLGMPRLGVLGAAAATVLSQTAGLVVLTAILVRRRLLSARGPVRAGLLRTLVAIGVPAGMYGVTRPVTGMLMVGIVTRFGTGATAAFGVGWRLLEVMYIYLFALGSAGETLVGQSLGRRDPLLASRVAWRIAIIGGLLQLAVLPWLFFFAPALVRLFNADAEVLRHGTSYLRVILPVLVLQGLNMGWTGAQRGAGATALPMWATLVANWLVKLPLAPLLAWRLGMGVTGVWWAIAVSIVVEVGIVAAGFLAGGWQRKEVSWQDVPHGAGVAGPVTGDGGG